METVVPKYGGGKDIGAAVFYVLTGTIVLCALLELILTLGALLELILALCGK